MKLQQYSGPVMAKGLEDTAFYRYNRFIALNEVGGNPDQFGLTLAAFHKANRQRCQRWPHAMLGTSTHCTTRGEDTRARLAVLSELPQDWAKQVTVWSRILRAARGDVEGTAPPDRNDEYMLYQMLVGSWPVELLGASPDAEGLAAYAERVKGALTKSLREAKVRSTWAGRPTRPMRRRCSALRSLPSTRAARLRFSAPSCPSPSASPGSARKTAWRRPF